MITQPSAVKTEIDPLSQEVGIEKSGQGLASISKLRSIYCETIGVSQLTEIVEAYRQRKYNEDISALESLGGNFKFGEVMEMKV